MVSICTPLLCTVILMLGWTGDAQAGCKNRHAPTGKVEATTDARVFLLSASDKDRPAAHELRVCRVSQGVRTYSFYHVNGPVRFAEGSYKVSALNINTCGVVAGPATTLKTMTFPN